MRIAIGCDHRGTNLKHAIIPVISETGHNHKDFGCYDTVSVDYPDIALKVAEAISKGDFDLGILICGTGIGMSITANKVKGVRAALCHDIFTSRRARLHNNANVLCLGEDVTGPGSAKEIVRAFLETKFEGGRHGCRVDKITAAETENR